MGHAGRAALLGGPFSVRVLASRGRADGGHRQADALGLGGAGEGGEAVLVEQDGILVQGLEFGEASTQVLDLVAELLELWRWVVVAWRAWRTDWASR